GSVGSTCLTASRIPLTTLAVGPAVRTSNTPNRPGFCNNGTYYVGGGASRTLAYFASRSTPTTSSSLLVSGLEPKCRPIGFSLGQYFRTAASLMTTTFGAVWLSRSVN